MIFQSKRGRIPKIEAITTTADGKLIVKETKKVNTNVKIENYNFIINGVVVTVSGRAKNVHIGQDSMEVNF